MAEQPHASAGFAIPGWKEFLNWWIGGLTQCLPRRLRGGLGGARRSVLRLRDDGFVLQSQDAEGVRDQAELGSLQNVSFDRWLGSGWQHKAPLVLRVPREHVFTRTVKLPLAAAGNLGRVLQFEMDRLTPFAGAEVLYDYRIAQRLPDRGQILVELAVLRRELIDTALSQLEGSGQAPQAVDAEGLWPGANLLRSAASRGKTRANAGVWVVATVVALLLIAIVMTPLWQRRQVVIELDQRLRHAREQAAVVSRLQQQLDEGAELANFVVRRQQQRVPVVDLLQELTERLPDDTWVQQLSIRGADVELQGESEQATGLIELLEDSPYFESVTFRAPLTKARGATAERFSVVMQQTERNAQ